MDSIEDGSQDAQLMLYSGSLARMTISEPLAPGSHVQYLSTELADNVPLHNHNV